MISHRLDTALPQGIVDTSRALSRRRLLALGGAAAAGGLFSGCQIQTTEDPPAGGGNNDFEIKFPPARGELPTEDVTFRAMLSGGGPDGGFDPTFKAFTEAHPNITIDNPQTTWDTLNEAVTLGVRNGSAPDLFSVPITVPIQVAVKDGWLKPLEDVIPDFENWKAQFPDTAFIPGLHVFNDKTYCWTYTSNYSQYGYYLFYENSLMEKAEHDPAEPMTWTELRAVAKKISSLGEDNFGLMASEGRLGSIALGLAEAAGLSGGEMNFKTGEYQFADPLMKEAVELLLAMKDDGSLVPGVLNLSHDVAISRMAEGKTGMQLNGSWCIDKWMKDNPDFDYGVALPPVGDDKVFHHASFAESTAAPIGVYAKSKNPEVAGELLSYLGSIDGQVALTMASNGALVSPIAEANEKALEQIEFTEPVKAYRELSTKLLVKQPVPQFVNPDIGQVVLETKPVKPDVNEILQGVFTGQVKDIGKALQTLQDNSNKGLDDAIKAAAKKGVKVSREDYAFSNWDPEKDYTADDYKNR